MTGVRPLSSESRVIDWTFSHAAFKRYPHAIETSRERSVGDVRLFFLSRSLSTQTEVDHRAIVEDTGRNSIRATHPERIAIVDSPALPAVSFATIRYTHTISLYLSGKRYEDVGETIPDWISVLDISS